jgi:hypothetical protein
MNKELIKIELSKDLKQTAINQKLNDLVKEIKKVTTRKDVVIYVVEDNDRK